ncbi:MAG: VCBS repeat-containing protein, partial [bacterium]|nr:VCBS repeat-containing protein [bacterium]
MKKILGGIGFFLFLCFNIYSVTFEYAADFASENYFNHICTADFNRDGKLDLAIACNNAIEIYSGTGVSPYYFVKKSVINLTGYFQYIISDDFNRDGKPDIAVTSYSFPEQFYVLLGNGDFSFQTSYYNFMSYPKGIVSSDFNRDGIPDIAVVSYNSYFNCYLGNGDGSFTFKSTNSTSYVSLYITSGDFDNDGIEDIAVSAYFNSKVHIFRGKGDGTFYTPIDINVSSPWYITKGDFNRDGKLDLVVSSRSGSGQVAILIGNGDCTFKNPVYYNTGGEPWGIGVDDFDGDGILDIAVVNNYSKTLTVLKGKKDGSFQLDYTFNFSSAPIGFVSGDFTKDYKKDVGIIFPQSLIILKNSAEFKESGIFSEPVHYQTGQNPRNVISADFNNDGILDLAVANKNSNNVSILIGKNDGSFNSAVNYNFAPAFGYDFSPSDLVSGDFNKDGKIDIAVSNYSGRIYGIMINNGDGTFAVNIYQTYGISPCDSINSADFNRDGKLDILITSSNYPNGGFLVLYGIGDGTFSGGCFYPNENFLRTALGDFNKDGIIDIALTAQYKQYVYLYKGLEGGFLNIGNFLTGNGPVKPIFSDFNSDGNPDIAVCDWSDQNISFFLGDGQGSFNLSSKYIFQYNLQPYDIVSDDFNRDGAIDIVIAGVSSFNLAFLLGNNNGSFTSGGEFSTQIGYPRGLCKGDFDRNGTIDFAVVRG